MASVLEVAEAMYQAGKDGPGPSMPDSLDELSVATQNRYLLLARAAIGVTGEPASPVDTALLDELAEELAFKLNHPMSFSDRVRSVFDRYAAAVGEGRITLEVKAAMAI
jgi:hypothetical protein